VAAFRVHHEHLAVEVEQHIEAGVAWLRHGIQLPDILEVARLYTLEQIKQIKQIAIEQKSACKHPRATADRLTVG
jgi:hypothetical protein